MRSGIQRIAVAGALLVALIFFAGTRLPAGPDGSDEGPIGELAHPDLLFPFEDVPPMERAAGSATLELVFELGALDGEEAFGLIDDLAVLGDSLLAVVERYGCAIRLFHYPSGELRSEIGGCGDGPGEFRQIVSATFKADTLLVFDVGRGRVVRLDTDGEELDRALPPIEFARAVYAHVAARDNRVLYTPGFAPRIQQAESLLLVDDHGEELWGLPSPEIAVVNEENMGRDLPPPCFLRGAQGVAVANPWAVQLVLLDEDLHPVFDHVDDVPWFGPRPGDVPGGWMTGFYLPRVACGDTVALWAYRKNDFSRGPQDRRVERGVLVAASASGRILMREVVENEGWPHPVTMHPSAAIGDVFFFFSNTWGPYPLIRGYRLVPGAEE